MTTTLSNANGNSAFADRAGRINSNITFTLLTAISCLLIWTFAFDYGSLMGFAAVFGFGCGSYFALMSPIAASLLGMEKFPSGLSLLLFLNMIPVFGSNIASAIETGVSSEPFFSYKMFAGVSWLVGAVLLIFLKFKINKNPFVKIWINVAFRHTNSQIHCWLSIEFRGNPWRSNMSLNFPSETLFASQNKAFSTFSYTSVYYSMASVSIKWNCAEKRHKNHRKHCHCTGLTI